jgi:hypothetical protein
VEEGEDAGDAGRYADLQRVFNPTPAKAEGEASLGGRKGVKGHVAQRDPEDLEHGLPRLSQEVQAYGGTRHTADEVGHPAGIQAVPEKEVLMVGMAQVAQKAARGLQIIQDVPEDSLCVCGA